MGHKASKVSEGPQSHHAERKFYSPLNELHLERHKRYSTVPKRHRKNCINSNNSNELDLVLNRAASSLDKVPLNQRYPSNYRSQVTFHPSKENSSNAYKKHSTSMKKSSQNHSSSPSDDETDNFDTTDERNSVESSSLAGASYRRDSFKDQRSKSVGKRQIQNRDEHHIDKCLFNVMHRKESQRFCRAPMKPQAMKSKRDSTSTIVLSDGRLYNRNQELIKDTRKNVEFASDRVNDFKRLAATLEQMDLSLQTLPKRLANGFSKILDFDVFSEVDEKLQMEIISTARNSCSVLNDTIPSLQKHIENIRDIQMILIRTEERLDTFCKALYQMFHLPDLNATQFSKRQNKRDSSKCISKAKKS